MEEIWKDIRGYEGLYQVSSLGNIRNIKKGKLKRLKLVIEPRGYCAVMLYKDKKIKRVRIHRLVAETFIPNIKNKPQVNHKNGNKSDNRIENLEWCTQSENMQHAFKVLGKVSKGPSKYKTVTQYSLSGKEIKTYNSPIQASEETGINRSSISRCARGELKTGGGFVWKYNYK